MKLFGITGGIGMGKSTTKRFLAERGVPVVDTDALARQLVEPGQPALQEIAAAFGPEVVDSSGHLRRSALAGIVFANEQKRSRLESILHPRIRAAWQSDVARWRRDRHPLAAVIIPLLFETGAAGEFDRVICVVIGLAVGLPVCLALSRLMSSSVFGVRAFDLSAYVAIPTLLALITTLACAVPARRAARTDPMELLRED